ncbi:uncharacterized protein LOC113860802 [Abrus precatorius]|uniref:Uncharacterized protein LOC113860802 n=1 Tax=Abrus precatorius TaxID=3816 RepID=A0A8B8L379_ABRPR|nr:uncharacterized protein LOC113860802 [Abrus precatorius]
MISSENENIEEIKHRLLCTKLELITARMEANAEIKKYDETVKRLYKLLKKVCQERDEARDQLQLLLRNLQASTPAETSSTPQVDHPNCHAFLPSTNGSKASETSSKAFSNHSYDLSLSTPQSKEKHSSMGLSHTRIAESSNLTLPKQPNHQNKGETTKAGTGASGDNVVDSASLVINKLVCGKPLPKKGRLLQTVTEVGPLLNTLLVAPLPKWQNPPTNNSSTDTEEKAGVNPNGFIPTSLSLAFPGNSHGPSQMSSASGFGLSVKNEPVSYVDMDSNRMHGHVLTAKKRKLL